MKPVLMFIQKSCPHSRRALQWMEELKQENPDYQQVDITVIDEREERQLADKYDYFYVPTYYVGGVKAYEGTRSKEIVRIVLEKALNS